MLFAAVFGVYLALLGVIDYDDFTSGKTSLRESFSGKSDYTLYA